MLVRPRCSLVVPAVALSACHPPRAHHGANAWSGRALKIPATLDCPEHSGRLSRTAAAADGQSCEYRGPEGDQVTLTRLALDDQSAQAALAPTEAGLRTLLPRRQAPVSAPAAAAAPDEGDATNVNLPGVHVHAQGDKAEVKPGGEPGELPGNGVLVLKCEMWAFPLERTTRLIHLPVLGTATRN